MLYTRLRTRFLLPIVSLALVAGATASAQQVNDPPGDTESGLTGWAHDILVADAQAMASTSDLVLSALFAQSISAFGDGNADALAGYILLDVDKNAATGSTVNMGGFIGDGVEWIVDLGSAFDFFGGKRVAVLEGDLLGGGFLAVLTMTSSPGGSGVDGFQVTIPWAAIASPDGMVDFGLIAENDAGEVTDLAPDYVGSSISFAASFAVPEPGTLPLAALGTMGLAFLSRRRR